jgi:flavin-binding protein dodecin
MAKSKDGDGERIYKKIEVVGTSSKSFADAVRTAVRQASRTVDGISWFEVSELRGAVERGEVSMYQVTVKLGFRVRGR